MGRSRAVRHIDALTLFGRTLPSLIRALRPDDILFDRSRRARRLKRLPPRWSNPPAGFPPAHRHPKFEFCFALRGRCPFLMGEERRELTRGDVVVVSPDVYHRELAAERCGPYALLWAACDRVSVWAHIQDHVGGGKFNAGTFNAHLPAPEALQIAQRIDNELWEYKPGAFHRVQGLLLQWTGLLERVASDPPESARPAGEVALQRWRTEKAAAYVRDHFAEPVDLAEVAAHVGASPAYLSVLFTRELGQSFTDFLTRCRITEAQRLLEDPALSIKEISQLVGIDNPLYFSRVFSKYTGSSPRQHRRKLN